MLLLHLSFVTDMISGYTHSEALFCADTMPPDALAHDLADWNAVREYRSMCTCGACIYRRNRNQPGDPKHCGASNSSRFGQNNAWSHSVVVSDLAVVLMFYVVLNVGKLPRWLRDWHWFICRVCFVRFVSDKKLHCAARLLTFCRSLEEVCKHLEVVNTSPGTGLSARCL